MPGGYAHLTAVNELKTPQRLEAIGGFPLEAIPALLDYFKFCEAGAVAPDYPYLAIGDHDAQSWGSAMHHTATGKVIQKGIEHLRVLDGEAKRKGISWLLGYTAHVVADVTIHPVVNLKVGPYEQNKKDHRVCEMNQDAYIFQRLNLGAIGLSEHIDSGIGRCVDQENSGKFDRDVEQLWQSILKTVYDDEYRHNRPDIDKWQRRFSFVVDKIAEEGGRLIPIARHVAADAGLVYPSEDEVDPQYIEELETPDGPRHYNDIFDKMLAHLEGKWSVVARGAFSIDDAYLEEIGYWNLSTGLDENDNFVFWG